MPRYHFDHDKFGSRDRVKIMRVIEYEGPREWVEKTLENSIKDEYEIKIGNRQGGPLVIRNVSFGEPVPVPLQEEPAVVKEQR